MQHEITLFDDEVANLVKKHLTRPDHQGYIKLDGITLPGQFRKFVNTIDNFEVRDDDIWVCSFPRTGTTWTQEMVWCIANDSNFERAKVLLNDRFPYLEISAVIGGPKPLDHGPISDIKVPEHVIDSIGYCQKLPSPRFIKTHLPFSLLPRQLKRGEKNAKIVYVSRNPKDTCISYFHHAKVSEGFKGSFEDWCDLLIKDAVMYAPFWKHVLGFWKQRINDNFLFLKYEDMKRDLPSVIKRTAKFLGKNLTTDQESALIQHLSFDSMKVNPAVNNEEVTAVMQKLNPSEKKGEFIRRGTTKQWITEMTPEIVQQFDDWTRENLRGTYYSTSE
ncbi:luciferin sulfotransferase-like [Neodiprion lecontei]|uniref:Luciferin sulfotransferase-like n=1 Tax=Neodiprion lecontei TaxID=441921 RepID=A0A6J0BEZ8_NEOLC|nr:luciferin sulfotransferase-like [Neodiprion lecontei]